MFRTIFATALLITAGAAQAEELAAPQARVAYRDLNLADAAQRAELDRRIAVAADWLCAPHGRVTLPQLQEAQACREAARASARPQIDRAVADATRGSALAALDADPVGTR